MTRQQALLDSPVAREAHPLLGKAVRHAGYLATRHRGTVGGSLAFAAPWAELTAAVVALDAQLEARSEPRHQDDPRAGVLPRAERRQRSRPTSSSPPSRFRPPDRGTGAGFHEVSPRFRDFAVVAAAATVTMDDAGTCTAAELVLLRAAPAPYRADVSHLVGTTVGDDAVEAIADALDDIDPPERYRGEWRPPAPARPDPRAARGPRRRGGRGSSRVSATREVVVEVNGSGGPGSSSRD